MQTTRFSRVLAAAAVLFSSTAFAAPHGIFRPRGFGTAQTEPAAAANLLYYGGPVISHAKVYAVFWGDNVAAATKAGIGPYFANILDSTYMDWLSEYNTNLKAIDGREGTHQTIGRGTYAGSVTIRPINASATLTDEMIQAELDAQIAAGRLPAPDADTLYMTYFPSGISISIEGQRSCSSFCAYHEGFRSPRSGASIYYGVMPVCGSGCGFGGSAFDSLAIVSSHECLEAITDPFPTPGTHPAYPQAWNTSGGEEIADVCDQGSSTVTGHGIVSKVQWEWDNASRSCARGPWTQSAAAALERHEAAALRSIPVLDVLSVEPAGIWVGR